MAIDKLLTRYLIMESNDASAWQQVGTFDATNRDTALRQFYDGRAPAARFIVAVSNSSFRMVTMAARTKVVLSITELDDDGAPADAESRPEPQAALAQP